VLLILTANDIPELGLLRCVTPRHGRDGQPITQTPRRMLAADTARYVGDPVACVVAETQSQAMDAAEANMRAFPVEWKGQRTTLSA
jgi:carbon-monoxide dehydrogenase large subunit